MTALDEARAKNKALKASLVNEQKKNEENKQIALNSLAELKKNSTLSQRYAQIAAEEAKEMMGSQPLLKLHIAGRSNNELRDGSEPVDLSFFYTPTQEAFINPDIHLLVMSDGFYAEGIEKNKDGKKKVDYNILLGGTIIAEDETIRMFIMYLTGQKKRESFWAFRNEFSKFARSFKLPKSVFSIKLTAGRVPNPNPKWAKINKHVSTIDFSINKHEDGTPLVIANEDDFEALEDIKVLLKEMIDSIIARKSVEKPNHELEQGESTASIINSEEREPF